MAMLSIKAMHALEYLRTGGKVLVRSEMPTELRYVMFKKDRREILGLDIYTEIANMLVVHKAKHDAVYYVLKEKYR